MSSPSPSPIHVNRLRPSIRRNFSWTLAGNLWYAATQWGILALLAKAASPEVVGQFTLALAVTAPIALFANLGLRTVQSTDARREFQFRTYMRLRLVCVPASIVAAACVAVASGYPAEAVLVIVTVSVAKGVDAISDVYYGRLQQSEWMKPIATSMIIKGATAIVMVGAVTAVTQTAYMVAAAMAVSSLLVLAAVDVPTSNSIFASSGWRDDSDRTEPRQPTDWQHVARLARMAFPLGIVAFLISLIPNVPRYVVDYHLGQRELGLFAATAYLLVAASTIINALGQSVSPRLATYYARRDTSAYVRLLLRLLVFSTAVGTGGMIAAHFWGIEILAFLYTQEYATQARTLSWIMLAGTVSFYSSFLWYAVSATRRFAVQVPVYALTVAACLVAAIILVPRQGTLGAAQSLLVAYSVQAMTLAVLLIGVLRQLSADVGVGAANTAAVQG